MIQKILVTDDATEVSDRALEVASQIALPCKAQILLFHVIDLIEDPDTMIFGNNKELIEKAKMMNLGTTVENKWSERAQKKIKTLSEQEISYESICVTGKAADKILECAKTKKVDMIVMGSSNRLIGLSKIKALGSVTRKVSELADCPVLIVH
ncbi:universal stress protein [Candidatus Nitrosocosmicus hydrocola]|uniref:universal stress protein n=1 Tax=Candidatus Nitrosocosmicus hydrocola TaxID=1826872 RepID=UPI0011E59107|nr:universal stress protein [Candidatus Nitrosocosmicus hydrocola]